MILTSDDLTLLFIYGEVGVGEVTITLKDPMLCMAAVLNVCAQAIREQKILRDLQDRSPS